MNEVFTKIVLALSMLIGAGCATIVGDSTHLMQINSSPSDAMVSITDERGSKIFEGATPTSVTLQKSDGSYWGKKSYTVTISKPGYAVQTIPITASANGWYLAGNLVFGGLIGWFIVDPLNGHMYNLSPEHIDASIQASSAHNNTATDGSIAIMLLEDVPNHLRDKLQPIK